MHKAKQNTHFTGQKCIGVFKSHEYYGFIEGTNLYVRWENINTALNKDKVEYQILPNKDDANKLEAKILEVLERYKTSFVGTIIHKDPTSSLILLDNFKLNKVVFTADTNWNLGDKVKVVLETFELDNLKGKIEKKIGNERDNNIEITSILEDHNIANEFEPEIQRETEALNLEIQKYASEKIRKDFKNIPFVTIDPQESKDHDDAIAVICKDNQFLLYIAIADVWSYIKNCPKVQKEAEHRGTSIYFLQSVIPMLPPKISNFLCSLMPKEERCAIVLKISIDNSGNILWNTMEINPGIIKSRQKLSYDEVNDFFTGKHVDWSKEIKDSLKHGHQLHKLLESQRIKKGYLTIDLPEIKINIDKDTGEVLELKKYLRGDAQIMIENFMILANEGIAKICINKNIPTIFRVHERPEINKIINFINSAKELDFQIETENINNLKQKHIADWFQKNKDHKNLEIIQLLLLKSLQKAKYSINNIGHFGLNSEYYLHFTSPIRRYPDTIVHKMLWNFLFQDNQSKSSDPQIYDKLDQISQHCTNKEIEAAEISKSIENMKIIQFLNKINKKIFKAKIIEVTKTGVIIRIEEINVEGFVKSKNPLSIGNFLLVKQIYDTKEFRIIKIL